jgi:hypothetical protein
LGEALASYLYQLFPSDMKGVVLTTTGKMLSTPAPSELAKLFDASPKVGLNFAKIFNFDENKKRAEKCPEAVADHSPPPSSSYRKEREEEKEIRTKMTSMKALVRPTL